MKRTVEIASDEAEFAARAASIIAERAAQAIAERLDFTIALGGGSAAKGMFEQLAKSDIDWSKTLIFWSDERFVPLDNAFSNYKAAHNTLFAAAKIPDENIHPVPATAKTPSAAAAEYEATIRQVLGEQPAFDVVHLGMGPDGHTASLFPHSAALTSARTSVLVRMNHAGLAPWVDRVTFTFDLINQARCVLMLVTGAQKAELVHDVLSGALHDFNETPVVKVSPANGELIWLLGSGAGSKAQTS